MFGSSKLRTVSTYMASRVRLLMDGHAPNYTDLAPADEVGVAPSLSTLTDDTVTMPRIVDPADVPLPPGTRMVPPPRIPLPSKRYEYRRPATPITMGLRGYNAIADAETEAEALEAASWGMKFGNTQAVEEGLRAWNLKHPAPAPEPVPEPVSIVENHSIGELLLMEFGDKPFLRDLFAPDSELIAA